MNKSPLITLSNGATIPQLGFGTLGVPPDRRPSRANTAKTAQIVGLALEVGYRRILNCAEGRLCAEQHVRPGRWLAFARRGRSTRALGSSTGPQCEMIANCT